MKKEDAWPTLPQDPGWVLEQIERGFGEMAIPLESPPDVPRMSSREVESAVTRALREELARLDEMEAEGRRRKR